MIDKKRTTTIELTAQDQARLDVIKYAIGATSTIAAIRYALKECAEGLTFAAAQLALARETAGDSIPLSKLNKELEL